MPRLVAMRARSVPLVVALAAANGCGKKSAEPPPSGGPTGSAEPQQAKKLVKPGAAKKPGAPGTAARGKNMALISGDVTAKPEQPDKGHLSLAYEGPDSPTRGLVRASHAFEQIIPQLDNALNLPHDIPVTFKKCGEVNAFYATDTISITMCDDLVDFYGDLFAKYAPDDAREAIVGSLVSVFLHELGHALIDQLQLPAVGRQEDAVDQLSTVVLIASGDQGTRMALDGAYSWIAEGETQGSDTTPFWDSHSLNEQRFYNIMCLIYGSNRDAFADVITENELPSERAEQCEDEYKTISTSWNKLLDPYLSVPVMRIAVSKQ
jgi:hypothetical protein